jgi:hypothetical protein
MAPEPDFHDLTCAVHLHSTYSDGTGTVPQIAKAAQRSDVDVVLLTDHDTLAARDRGEEGWHGQVLVLVGEEVSPRGGDHYLAFGIPDLIDRRMSGREICEAVRDAGGIGFAAHPFSRGSERFPRLRQGIGFRDLDSDALDGIELWSFVTDTAERIPSIWGALRFIAAPHRVLAHPPEENVRGWERLCANRKVVAIGGIDAHQLGIRVGPVVPIRLMSYRRSFRHIRTHVLCEEAPTGDLEHDREQVYSALREGRCYIAVDSVSPAHGFRFWATGPAGTIPMGSEAPAGDWTLRAFLPRPGRLRLMCDGEEVVSRHAPMIGRRSPGPGVYRVEAYRDAHGAERTWIISNPIYLR